MIFTEAPIAGTWVIDLEPVRDARGFFARTFDVQAFAARGLATSWAQCSIAFNARQGTLRGLHYQHPPNAEHKLVRCTRGAVHDVVVDLRADSKTFTKHFAVVLTSENYRSLYVPPGVAHGYQTLTENTEVVYQIDSEYSAAAAAGIRFDDPVLGIAWPQPVTIISARDLCFPDVAIAAGTLAAHR
jgi:dTDP-4-dehydrorhamnose 3,5-epimerase